MTDLRYVDPQEIVDPNAQPLTPQETDQQMAASCSLATDYISTDVVAETTEIDLTKPIEEQIQDSYRSGRQFIKGVVDPLLPAADNPLVQIIENIKAGTKNKYKEDLEVLRSYFDQNNRPIEAFCMHLFKEPVKITGSDGKEYPHYGWGKLRGSYPTYGQMEQAVRPIMQDHDTYTRTKGYPRGTFFPITLAPFENKEAVEKMYDADIQHSADMRQHIIQLERKREEALVKMQEDSQPGSLEDYIRQKLRFCIADLKIQRAKADLEKFGPILERQSSICAKMEKENPNYYDDGLKLYQEKMNEIGFPKPESFYQGCINTNTFN